MRRIGFCLPGCIMDTTSCVQEAQETSAGVRKAATSATSAEVETPKHLRRELDELAQALPQTACLSVVGSTAQVIRFDSCEGSRMGYRGRCCCCATLCSMHAVLEAMPPCTATYSPVAQLPNIFLHVTACMNKIVGCRLRLKKLLTGG